MFLRAFLSALLAATALLLTSCIDGREELWVNADGSGRAHFRYDIPSTAAKFQGGREGIESMLDSLLERFPGATREIIVDGDRMRVEVRFAFASVQDIVKVKSSLEGGGGVPSSMRHLAGLFSVKRDGLSVDFTRTVSPGKALPTAFIPISEFQGRTLSYILHLPVVPDESTADRTENGGLTQIWEKPLTSAIRQPVVIHFKAKIPIPWWVYAGGAVAVLLVVACLVRVIKWLSQRIAAHPAA